ncbi:MAG: hypothetical protein AAF720_01460 [Pseudomonadota bacterium]
MQFNLSVNNTRRHFLKSGIATCGLCSGVLSATPTRVLAASRPSRGCWFAPDDFNTRNLVTRSVKTILTGTEQSSFLDSTGKTDVDRLVGNSLLELGRFCDLFPGFNFYNDENCWNAGATTLDTSDKKGTILYGVNLLKQQLSRTNGGFVAFLGICAHEFAHMIQFKYDLDLAIEDKYPKHCIELHADFFAGFFISHYQANNATTPTTSIIDAWRDLEEVGGCFNKKQTHGTMEQRLRAIDLGGAFYSAHTFAKAGGILGLPPEENNYEYEDAKLWEAAIVEGLKSLDLLKQ